MRIAVPSALLLILLSACAGAPDNGDPVLATSEGKTLSTSGYFRYLYRDLTGGEASAEQVKDAMTQFRSGKPIAEIVGAQIESDAKLRAFKAKLGGDLDGGAAATRSPGERGISSRDFLLYYLLLNGNRGSSSLNYALPFLLNSRQYLTYLIYTYL